MYAFLDFRKKKSPVLYACALDFSRFPTLKKSTFPMGKHEKVDVENDVLETLCFIMLNHCFLDFSPFGGAEYITPVRRILRGFPIAKKQEFHVTEAKNAMSKTTSANALHVFRASRFSLLSQKVVVLL